MINIIERFKNWWNGPSTHWIRTGEREWQVKTTYPNGYIHWMGCEKWVDLNSASGEHKWIQVQNMWGETDAIRAPDAGPPERGIHEYLDYP
jgi:hypothetical protein